MGTNNRREPHSSWIHPGQAPNPAGQLGQSFMWWPNLGPHSIRVGTSLMPCLFKYNTNLVCNKILLGYFKYIYSICKSTHLVYVFLSTHGSVMFLPMINSSFIFIPKLCAAALFTFLPEFSFFFDLLWAKQFEILFFGSIKRTF